MKSRRNFLSILVLILAGSIALPTDYVFAKKSVKTKKKSDKKKKKGKTVVASESSVDAEELRTSDVSTERRGGTTSTATASRTGSSQTTTVDVDTLTSNLKTCLSGPCSTGSSVPYEKCFNSSVIDTTLLTNPTCQTYLNSAASEADRTEAKDRAKKYIASEFSKACQNAEGTVSGGKCKVKIWYYAKSPNGESVSRSRDYVIGKNFTCTYSEFGLSQQDLEYKGEKTAEQQIAEMQAGIQIFSGLLNAGVNTIQAIGASKNLKRANAYEEDAWYKFNGKTLEREGDPICIYDYGTDGSGMKKKDWDTAKSSPAANNACATDTNGTRYCTKASKTASAYTPCGGETLKGTCNSSNKCSKEKVGNGNVNCCVYISQSNEYKRAEKLKELISWMDLEGLKSKAVEEQQWNAWMSQNVIPGMVGAVATNANSVSDMTCPNTLTYQRGYAYKYNDTDKTVTNNETAAEIYSIQSSNTGTCNMANGGSNFVCTDTQQKNVNEKWDGCKWDNFQNTFVKVFTNTNDKVAYMNGNVTSLKNEMAETRAAVKELITSNDTDAYNNSVSAYNDANNKLNTKKKELEALEEQKSSTLQNVISSGTQTLLTSVTTGLTNKIAADSNKELMSGACYKSKTDPKTNLGSASLLAKEGATVKLLYE